MSEAVHRHYTKLDTLSARSILRRLRDIGLLEQHPHASATYYTPTDRLLHPEVSERARLQKSSDKKTTLSDFPQGDMSGQEDSVPTMGGGLPTMPSSLPTMLGSLPTLLDGLPADLLEEIQGLGHRSPPAHVKALIAWLCDIRAFTAEDLAKILRRNKKWVKRSYLAPMIRDGIIEYTISENPQHPNQAYRTKKHGVLN